MFEVNTTGEAIEYISYDEEAAPKSNKRVAPGVTFNGFDLHEDDFDANGRLLV